MGLSEVVSMLELPRDLLSLSLRARGSILVSIGDVILMS